MRSQRGSDRSLRTDTYAKMHMLIPEICSDLPNPPCTKRRGQNQIIAFLEVGIGAKSENTAYNILSKVPIMDG